MFENYIGRDCTATIVFAEGCYNGGSAPKKIRGILENADDDFIVLAGNGEKFIIPIKALLLLNVAV